MNTYNIAIPDKNAMNEARVRWGNVAKPPGSLGLLEDMIVKIAGIQRTADVAIAPRCVIVLCADHGVVAEGVASWPCDVTAIMAQSIACGNASVNLMARVANADVFAVDIGMKADAPSCGIIRRKIARGTRNMVKGPAMTREEAQNAIQTGIDLVRDMKSKGYRLIVTGEMGIGNTTASAAIACALLGYSVAEVAGRGAGLEDSGLERKRAAITRALEINRPDISDPIDVLSKVAGFEIAGMTGLFLGGAIYGVPVVIDGAISAVAALVAAKLCPGASAFMLASHMSREPAAELVMKELGLSPILYANLALGEGTGAVALIPLLDMALNVYRDSHTFEMIGVDTYQPREGKP